MVRLKSLSWALSLALAPALASPLALASGDVTCYTRDYTASHGRQGAPLGVIDYLADTQDGSEIYGAKHSVLDGTYFKDGSDRYRKNRLKSNVFRTFLIVKNHGATADAFFNLEFVDPNNKVTTKVAYFSCNQVGGAYTDELYYLCGDKVFKNTGSNFILTYNPKTKSGSYDIQIDSWRGGENLSHLVVYSPSVFLQSIDEIATSNDLNNLAVIAPDVYNLNETSCNP